MLAGIAEIPTIWETSQNNVIKQGLIMQKMSTTSQTLANLIREGEAQRTTHMESLTILNPERAFATLTGLGTHLASPAMGGQPLTLHTFTLLGPKTRVASLFLIIILSVWLKMAIHLEMAQESQARTNQLPCQPTHQQS